MSGARRILVLGIAAAVVAASPVSAWADMRESIVAAALEQLGAPYRFGGTGPEAFDCSGLAQWSYGAAGIRLPRTSSEQRKAGRPVPLAQAQRGDLVFFRYGAGEAAARRKPSRLHVAIYLGGLRAVHAPSSGGRVEVIDIAAAHWRARFAGAVGVLPDASSQLAVVKLHDAR